jgi:hypothetical protein
MCDFVADLLDERARVGGSAHFAEAAAAGAFAAAEQQEVGRRGRPAAEFALVVRLPRALLLQQLFLFKQRQVVALAALGLAPFRHWQTLVHLPRLEPRRLPLHPHGQRVHGHPHHFQPPRHKHQSNTTVKICQI